MARTVYRVMAACVAVLLSFSCSLLTVEMESGTASFTLDAAAARTITGTAARQALSAATLEVSLHGDREETQTVSLAGGGATVTFERLAPGSSVWVEAVAYARRDGTRIDLYSGQSDTVRIIRGKNPIQLTLARIADSASGTATVGESKRAVITLDTEQSSAACYLNAGTLAFALAASDGTALDASQADWTYALSYGGNAVASEYYAADGSSITVGGTTPLLAGGTYQLAVTATVDGYETASAVFDVAVHGALYFDGSSSTLIADIRSTVADLSTTAYLKITGQISDAYTTFFTEINSAIVDALCLVELDLSELTTTAADKKATQNHFQDCTRLSSISLPNDLTAIGYCTFKDCTNLTSVTFGTGIQSIGADSAFQGCTALVSVTFPDSAPLALIDSTSFQDCSSLQSLRLPGTVVAIGKYAFETETALTLADESGTWYYTTDQNSWYTWQSDPSTTPSGTATLDSLFDSGTLAEKIVQAAAAGDYYLYCIK